MRILLAALLLCMPLMPALGGDDGQWGASDLAIRQWFKDLKQSDNPAYSCCGEADISKSNMRV
jgi:hypothetical protein